MKAVSSCFFVFLCALLPQTHATFTLRTVANSSAICNDGTQAKYYIQTGTDASSWILYLKGGGGCMSESSCDTRDQVYKSSDNLPPFMNGLGLLSSDPNENPSLFGANKVFVHYCSSDLWMGDNFYRGIHFRGAAIFNAVFEETVLAAAATTNVSEILVAGESAGGWGAAFHAASIASALPSARVLLYADSSAWSAAANLEDIVGTVLDNRTTYDAVHDVWAPKGDYCALAERPVGTNSVFPCCLDIICGVREQKIPLQVSMFIAQPMLDALVALGNVAQYSNSLSDGQKPEQPSLVWLVNTLSTLRSFMNISDPRNHPVTTYDTSLKDIFHAPLTLFQPSCLLHKILTVSDLMSPCESDCTRGGVTVPIYSTGVFETTNDLGVVTFEYQQIVDGRAWHELTVQGVVLKDAVKIWVQHSRTNTTPELTAYSDTCTAPSCNPTCPETVFFGIRKRIGAIDVYLAVVCFLFAVGACLFVVAHTFDRKRRAVSISSIVSPRPAALENLFNKRLFSFLKRPNTKTIQSQHLGVGGTGVDICVRNLTYCVTVGEIPIKLLDNVSTDIKAGNLTALMGPSGSGKTTFLDILACRRNAGNLYGSVSYGNIFADQPGYHRWLQENSGFVMQLSDSALETLTVLENLQFAADLRMAATVPLQRRQEQVRWVVSVLRMERFQHVKVGGTGGGGLSGGQRRKLAVAIQLLKDPKILFLDEPTSGLDSTSAMELLEALVMIAKRGHTVVLSIHQPRIEMWNMFHQVMFLVRGQVAYHGPASQAISHLAGILGGHHGSQLRDATNPAHTILDVIKEPGVQLKLVRQYNAELASRGLVLYETRGDPKRLPKYSHIAKIFTLLSRGIAALKLNPIVGLSAGTCAMFLVMGVVYFQLADVGSAFAGVMLCSTLPSLVISTYLGEIVNSRKRGLWLEVGDGAIRGWHFMVALFLEGSMALSLSGFLSFSIIYLLAIDPAWYDAKAWFGLCVCNSFANASHTFALFGISMLLEKREFVNTMRMWYVCVTALFGGVMISYNSAPVYFRWLMWINPSFNMNCVAQNLVFGDRWGHCEYSSPMYYCPENSGNFVLNLYSMAHVNGPQRFWIAGVYFCCTIVFSLTVVTLKARAKTRMLDQQTLVENPNQSSASALPLWHVVKIASSSLRHSQRLFTHQSTNSTGIAEILENEAQAAKSTQASNEQVAQSLGILIQDNPLLLRRYLEDDELFARVQQSPRYLQKAKSFTPRWRGRSQKSLDQVRSKSAGMLSRMMQFVKSSSGTPLKETFARGETTAESDLRSSYGMSRSHGTADSSTPMIGHLPQSSAPPMRRPDHDTSDLSAADTTPIQGHRGPAAQNQPPQHIALDLMTETRDVMDGNGDVSEGNKDVLEENKDVAWS